MLNLTIKPGEFFMIGEEIRVVFIGGTANNAKIMIDAPRSFNIIRGKVLERNAKEQGKEITQRFYPEKPISAEQMHRMIAKQKKRAIKEKDIQEV